MKREEIESKIEKLPKDKLQKLIDVLDMKICSTSPEGHTRTGVDVDIYDILFRMFEDYSEQEILEALKKVKK